MARNLPVIGITTYGRDANGRYTLPHEYVSSVHRAGAVPLLIPPVPELAREFLELVDAVVLAGGGDMDPSHYGGQGHDTNYLVDLDRDALELGLARFVLEQRKPTLAICRGMQVVNVALGGSLIEHLPDETSGEVQHRAPPREPIAHPVKIKADSRLHGVVGTSAVNPMSWHHQAVRRLAAGFEAVAHAPDGTIEAMEHAGHPELVAVQWHPELTAHEDPAQQRLFDWLAALARDSRSDSSRDNRG